MYFALFCLKIAASSSEIMETKRKIGLKYQRLLYKALKLSLEKLNKKGLTQDQQEFFETFLAVVFFRIPEFRSIFLSCLQKKGDKVLEEWDHPSFCLEKTQERETTMDQLFNWDQEFYYGLPEVCCGN